jgi:hypothetical protein
MTANVAESRISKDLGMKISNFADYADGFSFTVSTELEAYKAAYKYQGVKKVVVKFAPNVNAWLVQVYRNL